MAVEASAAAARAMLFRKDGTAQGVAKQRLIESIALPDKRVIHDPFAECFVKGAGIVKCLGHGVNTYLANKIVPGLHDHLIARTRVIDELVKECAAAGATQYVILGAGYDMRAYRLGLPTSLRIFEVDQQEVQELKQANMPPDALTSGTSTYVSVDFNTQTLSDQLVKAGFQKGAPSIITLEGVTQCVHGPVRANACVRACVRAYVPHHVPPLPEANLRRLVALQVHSQGSSGSDIERDG